MSKNQPMPEADYRTISQQYAQGGINASILINGGAAVAALSQFASLENLMSAWTIGAAMMLYATGVLGGMVAWLSGFMASRYVDRALRGEEGDYEKSDVWMFSGVLTIIVSGLAFFAACLVLAAGLIRV
ncbi:hypothetical protein [Paracoccus sp. DMF]|uniref:hypothetical protein n=1 Tax=Paracoccus sp. DMF TaxID=400837 RepID=UPI001104ADBD|nr:hypothetical protein [Paracoccus sp. DMF]MCV2448438.1 hypothetical protein [Paracoccus sp. DMF]